MSKVWTEEELKEVNASLEGKGAEAAIRWVVENFARDEFALACSFAELTLLDLVVKIKPDSRIFFLDTGHLFKETLDVVKRAEAKYGIKVERHTACISPEEMEAKYGKELWKTNPDKCCEILKVEPLKKVLSGLKCWMTGLRRVEASTRVGAPVVAWDKKFDLVKVNPIVDWTDKQVWDYIAANDVPYNKLLDEGYPSIGCEPCTSPVVLGEDPRSGRWAGKKKTECGLHK